MNRILFSRGSWPEARRVSEWLQRERVGGSLVLGMALVALVWANSPLAESYREVAEFSWGPESWGLHLSVASWAADGLLAVFFFVVGLELKREFLVGDLRDPRRAVVPIVAAVGGMLVPALLFLAINVGHGTTRGWAIPVATDIAFAVAVLAIVGTHLPIALRTFLLTLAVIDDLLGIVIIAVVYADGVDLLALVGAVVPLAAFVMLARRGVTSPWLLFPFGFVTWALVHASGVHATVAGVVLGFAVPLASGVRIARVAQPLSSGVAVPVFALFAAGVTLSGGVVTGALASPLVWGIVAGLVVGKPLGVLVSTWLLARLTRAELDPSVRWIDLTGVAMLAGIGFTVSLLIGGLAFAGDSAFGDHVRIGVLAGSLVAACAASIVLRARNRHYRDVARLERRDADGDGIPDVFQ